LKNKEKRIRKKNKNKNEQKVKTFERKDYETTRTVQNKRRKRNK